MDKTSNRQYDIPDDERSLILQLRQTLNEIDADVGGSGYILSDTLYANLAAAVTAIGSAVTTLRITTPNFPDGSSCTVPATMRVTFDGAGTLSIASGHTVTILSDASGWPSRQIFTGSGTVLVSNGQAMNPLWWGAAKGTAASQSAAFQAAFNSAKLSIGEVILPPSTEISPWRIDTALEYTYTGGSNPLPGLKLIGAGELFTIFDSRVANGPMIRVDANTTPSTNSSLGFYFGVKLAGFKIITATAPSGGRGVDISACWGVEIEHIWIEGLDSDAIRINNTGVTDDANSTVYPNIRHNTLRNNGGDGINTNQSTNYIGVGLGSFIDNYIVGNGGYGARIVGTQQVVTENTFAFNALGGLYAPAPGAGTHSALLHVIRNEFDSNGMFNCKIVAVKGGFVYDNTSNTTDVAGVTSPPFGIILGDGVDGRFVDNLTIARTFFRVNGTGHTCVLLNNTARHCSVEDGIYSFASAATKIDDQGIGTRIRENGIIYDAFQRFLYPSPGAADPFTFTIDLHKGPFQRLELNESAGVYTIDPPANNGGLVSEASGRIIFLEVLNFSGGDFTGTLNFDDGDGGWAQGGFPPSFPNNHRAVGLFIFDGSYNRWLLVGSWSPAVKGDGTSYVSGGGGGLPSGSEDDFLQYKSGDWVNRTPAQARADLDIGDLVPVTFDSADFTANSGTWTVVSTDLLSFHYQIINRVMKLMVWVREITSVSSVTTSLKIKLPGGHSAAIQVGGPITAIDNATNRTGSCRILASGDEIECFAGPYASLQWAVSSGQTGMNFQLDIPIS